MSYEISNGSVKFSASKTKSFIILLCLIPCIWSLIHVFFIEAQYDVYSEPKTYGVMLIIAILSLLSLASMCVLISEKFIAIQVDNKTFTVTFFFKKYIWKWHELSDLYVEKKDFPENWTGLLLNMLDKLIPLKPIQLRFIDKIYKPRLLLSIQKDGYITISLSMFQNPIRVFEIIKNYYDLNHKHSEKFFKRI